MKKLQFTVLILLIASTFIGCAKNAEDTNTQTALLLYLADQASGNCATITKTTTQCSICTTAVTTYRAVGQLIPKGGCNASTLGNTYTTSSATAKTLSDTFFDSLVTEFAKSSSCSTLSTSTTAYKNLITAEYFTTQANVNASGCASNGSSISPITYCKDATSQTTAQANIQYLPITSATTDMSVNFTSQKTDLASYYTSSAIGYTATALAALRLNSSDELTLFKSALSNAVFFAVTDTSCRGALINTSSTLKSALTANIILGSDTTSITAAERAAITATTVTGVSCIYGDNVTATAATNTTATTTFKNSAAVGLCPATYPKF